MEIRRVILLLVAGLLLMPLPGCGGADETTDPDDSPSAKDAAEPKDPPGVVETGGDSGRDRGDDSDDDDDDDSDGVDLSEFFPKESGVSPTEASVEDLKYEDKPYTEESNGKARVKGTARRYTNGVTHRHGKFTYYYDDGKPQSSGDYTLNKKSGVWIFWYVDGKKSKEGPYVDGFADGKWTTWSVDGKIRSEGYYRRSKQVGPWFFYDATGAKTTRDYGGQQQVPEEAGR